MGSSLALCMIVKDEQQYLPYCLASVCKFCDEIIVVDTGSSDRTIEIAEAFGAYVIQAPWRDDFALVRNIAQSPAKSDWIIWLDADEVLNESGAKKIKYQLLKDNLTDFYLCPRVNFWKDLKHVAWYPDSQYKIYRNNIGLRWKSKLHEKIYDDTNAYHRKRLKHTDVHTFHYAYVKSPEEVKEKMAKYIRIENPDMDLKQIDKCSTEHSFFFDKPHDGVQPYNGSLPEVFNKLVVTQEEIKWVDGASIIKFKDRIKPHEYKVEEIEMIQKETPQQKPLKVNYTDDLCSVVIATFNKVEYVSPLVRGIYQSTRMQFEVIVVDNGSSQQSVLDFLVPFEKENDNFRFIHLDKNYGFAKGYNIGVQEAKGEWICILNNDTLVTNEWLSRMINHLKENPEIKIIGPVSNNIHGDQQMLPAPENYSFGDYLTLMDKLIREGGKSLVHSSWLTGCCMVFHRSLLEELQTITKPPRNGLLFCEDFEIGMGEDTDLDFAVMHRLNKKLGVARNVFLWHHGQKTLEECDVDWREIQKKNDKVLRQRWPEVFPNG